MKKKIIIVLFLVSLVFFTYEVYSQVNKNIQERTYYNTLYNSYKQQEKVTTDKKIELLDGGGVVLTIKNYNNQIKENNIDSDKLLKSSEVNLADIKDIDYTNSKIYIPGYINKEKNVPLIFPKDNTTVYEDLKEGVRVSPNAQLPHQVGITFLEGHSGQNFNGSQNYSFFDNLALYYDKLKYNQTIYIETQEYIFKYNLFKKEIILPGEKDFYQSTFNHLILMTCYPRNTSDKRALLHGKLISITKK